jgi:translation initiation factor IF-2
LNLEEAEEEGKEYVKKRLEPTSFETLNCRYYKQSEEFVITFRVTDKNGVRRDVRVRYDKDGDQIGYELKQEKRDRY